MLTVFAIHYMNVPLAAQLIKIMLELAVGGLGSNFFWIKRFLEFGIIIVNIYAQLYGNAIRSESY